jgi:4-amino-4-deoxy-L-arabinose transferase-like glycosyltransferase
VIPSAKPSQSATPARKYRAWIILSLIAALVFCIRVRLREMPLERDEGEYAFAGQLLLQGIPPYQEAFNMKLPGTYLAYAVIMAVFGQTPAGIHFGLALVNLASIGLVFLVGRKLLDENSALVASLSFALLSATPAVLGLAGHATHFVALFALAGLWALLRASETLNWKWYTLSGLSFGLSFLMKQHGAYFGIFGLGFLGWQIWHEAAARKIRLRLALVFCAALALPYVLTCLWLWKAGVWDRFVFWTMTYASKYAASVNTNRGLELLREGFSVSIQPNLLLWLLPGIGLVLVWCDKTLDIRRRIFLILLTVCSIAAVSMGFYFRDHYFIMALPAAALLSGVGFRYAASTWSQRVSLRVLIGRAVMGLFVVALSLAFLHNGSTWFFQSPAQAVQNIYGTTLFADAGKAADLLRKSSTASSRIAVLGSEPEIYFYARRRASFGYIYMYPLMESHPYAAGMQQDLIQRMEQSPPEFVVFIQDRSSWIGQPDSVRTVTDWWPKYSQEKLRLIQTIKISDGRPEEDSSLFLFQRKD